MMTLSKKPPLFPGGTGVGSEVGFRGAGSTTVSPMATARLRASKLQEGRKKEQKGRHIHILISGAILRSSLCHETFPGTSFLFVFLDSFKNSWKVISHQETFPGYLHFWTLLPSLFLLHLVTQLGSVPNLYLQNVALYVLCLYRFTNSSARLKSNSGLIPLSPFYLCALPMSPLKCLPITFVFSSLNCISLLI